MRGVFRSCLSPQRDVDFGDIFRGPPRRFFGAAKEEERIRLRLKELPVFGGKSAAAPRHVSDDGFFDDIFRGRDRDNLFGASFKRSQFVSSLPTRSSVPSKLPKEAEFQEMMDGSSNGLSSSHTSTASSSRNSDETSRDELRHETVHQIFSSEELDAAKVENNGKSIRNKSDFIANVKEEMAKIFKEEGEEYSRPKNDVNKQSQSCRWTRENYQVDEVYTSKKTLYSSESMRWDSKVLEEDSDCSFEDFIVLEELDNESEQVASEASEETKALDAKIGQWSAGKKGNIRSLLSTLQYVLWPGNEWKAIALVDLVEANPVKRAYQRALLQLHPDKLQQKGAPSDHKYIAQKVFDILQEAWDHFNNVALI